MRHRSKNGKLPKGKRNRKSTCNILTIACDTEIGKAKE